MREAGSSYAGGSQTHTRIVTAEAESCNVVRSSRPTDTGCELNPAGAGSIAGTLIGGLLLGVVPETVLIPLLVALLLASSIKVWRHS